MRLVGSFIVNYIEAAACALHALNYHTSGFQISQRNFNCFVLNLADMMFGKLNFLNIICTLCMLVFQEQSVISFKTKFNIWEDLRVTKHFVYEKYYS